MLGILASLATSTTIISKVNYKQNLRHVYCGTSEIFVVMQIK